MVVPGPMTGAGSDESSRHPTTSTEKPRIHSTLLYGGSSGTSAWHARWVAVEKHKGSIPLARIARRD